MNSTITTMSKNEKFKLLRTSLNFDQSKSYELTLYKQYHLLDDICLRDCLEQNFKTNLFYHFFCCKINKQQTKCFFCKDVYVFF